MTLEARRAQEARMHPEPRSASPPPATAHLESRTLDVARRAVVRVTAVHQFTERSGDGGRPSGFGFVVNENGIVLTAGRLVTGATKVAVSLPDGRTLPVTTVVIDPLNDLAVLQVKGERLRALPLGSSGDLRVGDPLIALGGPVAGEAVGTVRATGTATGGDLVTEARLTGQVRAGLPLLNVRGEAVGIVTRTNDVGGGTAFDFAVPIDRAKRVLRELGQVAHRTPRDVPDATSDR